ncbi:hypothetical protein [Nitrosovibrio tenuis]|uniref:hypothetical protein n=1 Tax=Nitrosovibrio tenuis TaxID=1233 RepID=UPI00116004F3|nr:hypothetical protein [Nitrosovibrio tenuis]
MSGRTLCAELQLLSVLLYSSHCNRSIRMAQGGLGAMLPLNMRIAPVIALLHKRDGFAPASFGSHPASCQREIWVLDRPTRTATG